MMKINGLLTLPKGDVYARLTRNLDTGGDEVQAVPGAARFFLVACLCRDLAVPALVITSDIEGARRMAEELEAWCPEEFGIRLFPEFDTLPYERLSPDTFSAQQRLRVLAGLSLWNRTRSGDIPITVASIQALSRLTVSPGDFEAGCRTIRKGMVLEPEALMRQLAASGYEMAEIVEEPGQATRRGGIVDVYSAGTDQPVRIEFFGNEVESLRFFDPGTQRSTGMAEMFLVVPAREMLIPAGDRLGDIFGRLDLTGCSRHTRDSIYEDLDLLGRGQWREGFHFYAPLFNHSTLIDYISPETLVVMDEPEAIINHAGDMESQAAALRLNQVERGEIPRDSPGFHMGLPELNEWLSAGGRRLSLVPWQDGGGEGEASMGFSHPPAWSGRMERFIEDVGTGLAEGLRFIVISPQTERLQELFREADIISSLVTRVEQLPPPGSLTLVHGSLTGGWALGKTALLTDIEIFGYLKQRRPGPGRQRAREVFVSDLQVGDIVVHIDHGVARFLGITTVTTEGVTREYLQLEYADDGRLYVPTDQVDRVARYVGAGGYLPNLSRLHTQEWSRTKERVKHAAVELAEELLGIYASRQVSPGIDFAADTLWDQELEASFPYEETPDQSRTVRDVKADMERARPMDRLVCGDVGYGKTEVAVRAAFKAVNSGFQVAVLVPTTVLAQQHYLTFTERLAAFPVRVEVLSRFRTPAEQQAVVGGLTGGSVDICIGTHRLLQKDVSFRNLGLVIIDEEQKFGVAHKERLKKLRSEVDVLTLSATPIPRSMHLALIGVRDLSTIETAPEARLPIKTCVAVYDDELIRAAIFREMDRGGQVFFVHNRVRNIEEVAGRLRTLVPRARIGVAHGQMPEEALEAVMVDFIRGDYDVLVCTTIIESGLDLPRANTLIINQSDRLGLTQLYHLRGRVGRGDVRAYAYLFYDRDKRLTEPAKKRLQTIFEATELGAGFRIAMKDLEIRGAGNILGPEQSGHVGAVGFDLYCRLLEEAVQEFKSPGLVGKARPEYPAVELPLTACIPEEYVPDLGSRLALYQKMMGIDAVTDVGGLWYEIRDRFGEVPEPVENLLNWVRVRILARDAGVQRIFKEGDQVVVALGSGARTDPAGLQRRFGTSVKASPSRVSLDMRRLGRHWLKILEEVLKSLPPGGGRIDLRKRRAGEYEDS